MIKLKEANTLYICTNEKKEILLKQMSHDKEIFDIKFMTFLRFFLQIKSLFQQAISVIYNVTFLFLHALPGFG